MATLQRCGSVATIVLVRSLCTVVLAAALFGCGGGSSNGPGVILTPQSPAGVWRGTVGGGLSGDITCIIAEDASVYCIVTYAGGASFAVLSGFANVTLSRISLNGDAFGLGAGGFSLSGTVLKRNSLNLTGQIGQQSLLTIAAMYDPLYDAGSSVSLVQGIYSNAAWEGSPAAFSIDANGALFLQAASGCVWTGEVSIIDQRYDAYRVAVTLANCGPLDGSYLGLATYTSATGNLKVIAANPALSVVLSVSR
jgi:hypothetical protein